MIRKYLFVLFIFALLISCKSNIDPNISNFWQFVTKNESRIYNATSGNYEILTELNENVHKIDSGLNIRTGPVGDNKKKDFIVSAAGFKEKFTICDTIISYAPKMKTLNPVSLLPPANIYLPYIFQLGNQNIELKFEDVMVHFDDVSTTPIELILILPAAHYEIIYKFKEMDLMTFYYNMLVDMTAQALGKE